jgi:hypothetical protein
MAKDKITRALVTMPTFINGVLHQPGEVAAVDLDALGVKSLDDKHEDGSSKTPGLVAHSAKDDEPVTQVAVAAVAPHAPDAPNPQGLPTGTVISGTGRHILPDMPNLPGEPASDEAAAIEPVGADKPGIAGEQTPMKPTKGK